LAILHTFHLLCDLLAFVHELGHRGLHTQQLSGGVQHLSAAKQIGHLKELSHELDYRGLHPQQLSRGVQHLSAAKQINN
jgi:hypothetical protein